MIEQRLIRFLPSLFIIAVASLAWLAPASADMTPPLSAYVAEEPIRSISMSPDGSKIAVVQKIYGERFALVVADLNRENSILYTLKDTNEQKLFAVNWVSNTRLVTALVGAIKFGNTILPYTRMIAFDANGSNKAVLMANDKRLKNNFYLSNIANVLPNDPNHILAYGYDSGLSIYKVDVYTGGVEKVARGGTQTIGFRFDDKGDPRLRFDYSRGTDTIKVLALVPGTTRWERILKIHAGEIESKVTERGAGLDAANAVLMLDRKGSDNFIALQKYDVRAEKLTETVFKIEGHDIDDTIVDDTGSKIIGVTYITDRPQHIYFEKHLQSVQEALEKKFPNGTVTILSSSSDGQRFLVLSEAPWTRGKYYVYDASDGSIKFSGDLSPQLGGRAQTVVDEVKYTTEDGTSIEGYLTYAAGTQLKDLPLIVMPHGGPQWRDWLQFDPFVQYLATQGYLVFQPNFRGSTGYGLRFEKAGYKKFGTGMIDDIAAGVRAVIKAGFADPNRVCAVGGSYGGYAALALATFKPDLIKCAVSINGVSDIPMQIETEIKNARNAELRQEIQEFRNETTGNLQTERDLLDKQSPANFAANVKVPILLIHAEDDQRVDIAQSERMEQALLKAGKDVRFTRISKGGHNLGSEGVKKALQDISLFLGQHL